MSYQYVKTILWGGFVPLIELRKTEKARVKAKQLANEAKQFVKHKKKPNSEKSKKWFKRLKDKKSAYKKKKNLKKDQNQKLIDSLKCITNKLLGQ